MIYHLTLQLGLGDLSTRLASCDGGGAGRVHERPLQHARPVLLPRRQIALPPSLEVVLAFPCFLLAQERNQTLNQTLLVQEVQLGAEKPSRLRSRIVSLIVAFYICFQKQPIAISR